MTIGAAAKLTADQACTAAIKVLAKVELGQDEAAERTAARKAKTIGELCDLYLEEGCDNKKASTLAADRGPLRASGQ